jgi:hypothetical protein
MSFNAGANSIHQVAAQLHTATLCIMHYASQLTMPSVCAMITARHVPYCSSQIVQLRSSSPFDIYDRSPLSEDAGSFFRDLHACGVDDRRSVSLSRDSTITLLKRDVYSSGDDSSPRSTPFTAPYQKASSTITVAKRTEGDVADHPVKTAVLPDIRPSPK